MIRNKVVVFATALIVSLGFLTSSSAQEVADKPTVKETPKALTELYNKSREVLAEDLSDLKHPVKPMLWKVEGNGLQKASYLFGSIHVSAPNITTLHPDAEAAYQQADTLATEVSFDPAELNKIVKMLNRIDGKTLKQSIGDELFNELDSQLKAVVPFISAEAFNESKTWATILVHSMLEEQIKGKTALDQVLWNRATKDNKQKWALERAEDQLGVFDELTEQEQIILLRDALSSATRLKKEKINPLDLIKQLYLKRDKENIVKLMFTTDETEGIDIDFATNEKFMDLLLRKRNIQIADKIHQTLTEAPGKSHFMVAGTLHYIGDHNIGKMLKNKGYIVTAQ